jgi:hypothetical protein
MILALEDYKRVSSRILRFEYVDGTQSISRAVLNLNPVNFELHNIFQAFYSYFGVFTGMTDLLHGNIMMGKANSDYYSVSLESTRRFRRLDFSHAQKCHQIIGFRTVQLNCGTITSPAVYSTNRLQCVGMGH